MTAPLGPNVLTEFTRVPRFTVPLVQARIRAIAYLFSVESIVVVIGHVARPAVEACDDSSVVIVDLIAWDVLGLAIDARPSLVTVDAMLAVDVRHVEPGQIVVHFEERVIDA